MKPRCSNCVKHDIECGFATDPPQSEGSPVSNKRRRSSDTQIGRPSSPNPSQAGKAQSNGTSTLSRDSLQPIQIEELELLHHFITETCMTLSDRSESHHLWRVVVPQIAFEHHYLMRGILAISALHLCTLRAEKHDQYARIAVQQQDEALRIFRKKMLDPDEALCDSFFAMSSLIVVYGFESPKASGTLGMFDTKGDRSDEWLPLIRGVNSILFSVWPSIKKGRLSGLLHDHEQAPPSTDLPTLLEQQIVNLEHFSSEVPDNDDDKQACTSAIMMLRQCFIRIYNKTKSECEISLAFLWPVMLPQRFVEMLNERKPDALVILAYYCTILHHLNDYWWLNGWGSHIIGNIKSELAESLQQWVDWPCRVVGLHNSSDNGPLNGSSPGRTQRTRTAAEVRIEEKSQQQVATLVDELQQVQPN